MAMAPRTRDQMAERLRRQTANLVGSPRVSSNLTLVDWKFFFIFFPKLISFNSGSNINLLTVCDMK